MKTAPLSLWYSLLEGECGLPHGGADVNRLEGGDIDISVKSPTPGLWRQLPSPGDIPHKHLCLLCS